jgi:uncharacterized protein YukE
MVLTMVGGSSFQATVDSDLGALGAQVTPENIVHVSNVLQAEARPTAEGFNAKINALFNRIQTYADQLDAAARQLAQTATSYGHTDQGIKDSLDKLKLTYGQPSPPLAAPPASSPAGMLLRRYTRALPTPARGPGNVSPVRSAPAEPEWMQLTRRYQ